MLWLELGSRSYRDRICGGFCYSVMKIVFTFNRLRNWVACSMIWLVHLCSVFFLCLSKLFACYYLSFHVPSCQFLSIFCFTLCYTIWKQVTVPGGRNRNRKSDLLVVRDNGTSFKIIPAVIISNPKFFTLFFSTLFNGLIQFHNKSFNRVKELMPPPW